MVLQPMTKVLILQGDSYKAVGSIFEKRGYEVLYEDGTLSQANLVVFTGGSDVSPYIYGEEPAGARGCDPVRDEYEKEVYETAVLKGIPCVGICRGGQLLNVLNDGTMIQDLGLISGDVTTMPLRNEYNFKTRVDHHQGMLARFGVDPIAWLYEGGDYPDYEIWYEDTKSLCFQGHPEWGHEGTENRFFDLIEEYIN